MTKIRYGTCACGVVDILPLRGRAIGYRCQTCREEHKKQKREKNASKPPTTNCLDCKTPIQQHGGKGRRILRCQECSKKRVEQQRSDASIEYKKNYPEKVKKWVKDYSKSHRKQINARKKQNYSERQDIKDYHRNWYLKNKKRILEKLVEQRALKKKEKEAENGRGTEPKGNTTTNQ